MDIGEFQEGEKKAERTPGPRDEGQDEKDLPPPREDREK